MEGNRDVSSASTFETQTIVGAGSAASINRIQHLSSRSLTVKHIIDVGIVLGGCNSKIAVCLCVHIV